MARWTKRTVFTFSAAGLRCWATRGGRPVAAALLLLALVWQQADPGGVLEIGRAKVFDVYQRLHPRPRPAERPVTVVDIDQASLAVLGQWPWSRVTVAEIVANLVNAGAAVVAFDGVFSEPDRLSPAKVAASLVGLDAAMLAQLKKLPGPDDVLADIVAQAGRVVLGQTGVAESFGTLEDPPATSVAVVSGDPAARLDHYAALSCNIPVLDRAAAGRGIVNVMPERDGVVRRIPAAVRVGDTVYPALAMEMLRVATGQSSILIRMPGQGDNVVVVPPNAMKTDARGRIFLYAAPYDRDSYVSARDVRDNTFDPAKVAGKLVVIGSSAAGLATLRATALDRQVPGVEVQAQIIETLLDDMQLTIPPHAGAVECMATALAAGLMIVLVPMVGARWAVLAVLAVAGGLLGWSWLRFTEHRMLYDPVFPALTALLLFVQMICRDRVRDVATVTTVARHTCEAALAMTERLANQGKRHGIPIVIDDETRRRAPDYAALELDLIEVGSQAEAMRLWALLGRPDLAAEPWFHELQSAHDAMIAACRAQSWEQARRALARCRDLRRDLPVAGFYALMEARIAAFEARPPGADGDGVVAARGALS